VSGTWSDDSWDDDDEPDHDAGESMLDALDYLDPLPHDEEDDASAAVMFFSVTNPPGTVSVTTLTDGRPIRIDLAPQVTSMTENQLSEEISLIARLASQNARAGQHLLIAGMMQRLGHDPLSARSYVEHELGLPSPATVLANKAQIFATRYAEEN
jgi:ESX secretion-associated protein EspD/H